jgi:O-antigen ligase
VTAQLVIASAHGLGGAAEKLGVVLVALLAAVVVLGRAPGVADRARALAMLGALMLTPVLLVADIWNTSQLHSLRHHPALAVAAIAAGLVLVAALALVIRRRPTALPVLAVAALPFRLPISTGGTTSNLLIPLYLVVGAGALAYLVPRLLRSRDDIEGRPRGDEVDAREAPPGALEWLLMASVVLYAAQAAYSGDFSKALEQVVFFYLPFALLFMMLRRTQWTRDLLLTCLGVAVALAVVFAGIGFVEYYRRELLLNPKVVAANEFDNYFRVNSLFFDPNIYGRFLALVMLMVTTVALWSRRQRDVLIAAAVLAWLWGGLITSFSQSSIVALLVGLAVLAAWRWSVRRTLYVCAALIAAAALFVAFAPRSAHISIGSSTSANNATSGRYKLVKNGLKLFGDRPLQGFGPGSFPLEYRRHNDVSSESATSASHTIPVTVAAEQGIAGLVLYIALLVAAFLRLFAGAGRSPPRIAIAACFAALIVHTMAYADFLEDPLTWTLLGVGSALALAAARAPSAEAVPAEAAPAAGAAVAPAV